LRCWIGRRSHEHEAKSAAAQAAETDDLTRPFNRVAALLDSIDLDRLGARETDTEQRTLLDELLDT
jgi:hypothetical protein